jgi:hypothetical protein
MIGIGEVDIMQVARAHCRDGMRYPSGNTTSNRQHKNRAAVPNSPTRYRSVAGAWVVDENAVKIDSRRWLRKEQPASGLMPPNLTIQPHGPAVAARA